MKPNFVPKTRLKIPKNLKRWLSAAALGALLFLGIAHHTVNFWELPALWMSGLFIVFVPLLTALFAILGNRFSPHLKQISSKRISLLFLAALVIGGFVSWRVYRVPNTYQHVIITPLTGQVGLLELKGNFQIISLRQAALASGWRTEGQAYYASPASQPLAVSFKAPANQPVIALFLTSPQGGTATVKLNFQTGQVELSKDPPGQLTLRLVSEYRGLPNWIFIPLLLIADLVTFGLTTLLLLILQEIGATAAKREPAPVARFDLLILLAIGIVLHLVNMLSVPTLLSPDSPAYLQGAVHLLEYGNFDGASTSVGPGTTLLFAPVLWLFTRNPWGPKIVLHLFGLACIPVSHRLGWQLSRSRLVAFLSGLIVANSPDLFFYSNYPMSDMPNIFFVLLFCVVLLSAIEKLSLPWTIALMATASFASLLRSENVLLIAIGAFALTVSALWRWYCKVPLKLKSTLIQMGLSLLLASLPVFWWSYHNLKNNGFFGMSNYMGVVLYDGWVYFGDAINLSFSDPNSLAIQEIRQVASQYPPAITDKKGIATGWESYYSMLAAGYSGSQAMDLLKSAALDSIQKNPRLTLELLLLKFSIGMRPELPNPITYPLPGEPGWGKPVETEFFDADAVNLPSLISLQRAAYEKASIGYALLYPGWILVTIAALLLSSLRQPLLKWAILVAVIGSRIFIPLTISVAFWRYSLAGWLPLQILTLSWLMLLFSGISVLARPARTLSETVSA